MSNNNENKLVPKVRFPEFKNKEEWELMQIGSILNAESSALALNKLELKKSGYAVYGADSIIGYIDNFQHKDRYISIVKDGSGVGRLNLCDGETSTLGTLSTLKSKDEKKYKLVWTFYLLNTIDFSSYVKGSGIPHIYFSDYKSENIGVPKPDEQQKIADCLSSLDDLITAQSQKLEALQAHKKGLMQQLFPAEGETVPKLRFEEFRGSGEWVEIPLGKVAEIITGNTPPTNDASNYGGDRLFVSPADISESRYITQTKTTLSEKGYSLTRHVKENSVLFVCIGSTIGKVAQNKYECATNQQINSLVPFEGYSSDFIYSALEFKASKIAIIAGNQAVPIINKSLFSSVLLSFPSSDEQQKIASCLSSLDELIKAQTEKIEALQAHRKGLMQGLFPNINKISK